MKKIFYLLIFIALAVSSCKKPEPEKVEIESENLTIGTTTVLFEVTYKYPNVLKEIKIHFSFNDDMSNATVHKTTVDEKQFNAIIEELTVNSTYYYLYEFFSGGTSAKSEVKSFTTKDCGLPTVSTNEVTNITETSVICGGNVLDAGGGIISARGVCWGTLINPTINNNKTVDGSGNGSFTSNITGLLPSTTYYVRAYATNEKGTDYGEQLTFTTLNFVEIPTVTTNSVTNITANSATCGGNVTNNGGSAVTARGVCWSTTINPTINNNKTVDGSGNGSFTSNITGLSPSTTYYVRAYATNSQGTGYGEQVEFTAISGLATVTTSSVTNITNNSATCGGNVTADGGYNVTARGVCWSTSSNPTINNNKTVDGNGLGNFTSNITGLSPSTTYYVRAYATNSQGTAYGEQRTFTTLCALPTITTNNVTNITSNTATCGGNVTDNGGCNVTARGVCWNTSPNPTINNNKTVDGSGTGSFTSNITGLTANTTYYVRAYATNSQGTSYGEQRTFTTTCLLPTVTTNNVTNITTTTATCGGNVTADGGCNVTARGVCWNTSPNPTINNNKTVDGSGNGSFTSNITGLTANTTYYVRAYATNSQGTAYGEQRTFKTKPIGGVMINGVYWAICNLDVGGVFCTNPYDYGAYYQWGRLTDGHENPTSGTTTTLSTTDNPGHSNFIVAPQSPCDWRTPQNNFLWNSGTETSPIKTVNDPCPAGWRVPTQTELYKLTQTAYVNRVWTTQNGIYGYLLKNNPDDGNTLFLPAAGVRNFHDGLFHGVDEGGCYWSSTPNNYGPYAYGYILSFGSGSFYTISYNRAGGFSVRCVAE